MAFSSQDICTAADRLRGFVGFNAKIHRYIVRFSEDSFGLDVPAETIVPACEFVWRDRADGAMTLDRSALRLLQQQNINDLLDLGEALLTYLRREDLPEITALRNLKGAM